MQDTVERCYMFENQFQNKCTNSDANYSENSCVVSYY